MRGTRIMCCIAQQVASAIVCQFLYLFLSSVTIHVQRLTTGKGTAVAKEIIGMFGNA